MSQELVDLARRGYEAARNGDFDTVREFRDPEVKWHTGDPTAKFAYQNRRPALEMVPYPDPDAARAAAGV
jgi:hypothetical protein